MRPLLLVVALLLSACAYTYSDGSRAGQVAKFSHKGVWAKSWEGQLNLGGLRTNSDGNAVANVFEFSVDAQQPNFRAIRATLDSGMATGARVKVWYRQSFQHNPWRYDSSYLLDSARVQP